MALGRKKRDEQDAAPPVESEPPAPEPEAPAEAPQPVPSPEPAAAPAAENDNALLSMFESATLEVEDLSALTELAGDVELSDVLEDLRTVAAAMGIRFDALDEFAEAA